MEAGTRPVAEAASQQAKRRLRLLFVLRAPNYALRFEQLLSGLLARGHTLHVYTEDSRKSAARGELILEELRARHPTTFSWTETKKRRRGESWLPLASMLRRSIDYLRFLGPEFEGAVGLHERARTTGPLLLGFLVRWRPVRSPFARRALDRGLRALEAALPPSKLACEVIDESDPDVMLIAPLVGFGESQGDYVRAAHARGIPTVLPVASWDNLTTKGVIRDAPELTVVWNSTQVKEAIELHGLPAERVVATGAHSFDHWFGWEPTRRRREFLDTVGLPDRPFLLYVCSSSFIAGRENEFIADWLRRLRSNGRHELADVGVLVRPHPQNLTIWSGPELDDPWSVVWPLDGAAPLTQQTKADYFDSIYHSSAVVGINTSALVEAAIIERALFTIRTSTHRHSQAGTVHFGYLTGENDDGVLRTADSWEEHFAQLADELHAPGAQSGRMKRFLADFVRPNGLGRPASPMAVAAIEGVLDQPRVDRPRPGIVARATVKTLMLVTPPIGLLSQSFRGSRLGLYIAAKRASGHRDAQRAQKAAAKVEKARARKAKRRRRLKMRARALVSRIAKRRRRLKARARALVSRMAKRRRRLKARARARALRIFDRPRQSPGSRPPASLPRKPTVAARTPPATRAAADARPPRPK